MSFAIPPKPASADIEVALDTTASMGAALSSAQSDAFAMVAKVQQLVPDTRFAFVQFQDTHLSPVPYRLEQPLTSDPGVFEAALNKVAAPSDGVGGDPRRITTPCSRTASTRPSGGARARGSS